MLAGLADRKEQPIRQLNRIAKIVRHQQRGHPVPRGQHGHFLAQPAATASSSETKRLIKQKKIRAHCECPGDGHAAGEAEREFAGVMRQMRSKSQCSIRSARLSIGSWAGSTSLIFSATVRQGSRRGSLENDSEASARDAQFTNEIGIQSGGDVQDRRLAAAGRADHRAKTASFKPQVQPADNLDGRALGRNKGLGVDAKFKRPAPPSVCSSFKRLHQQGSIASISATNEIA